MHSLPPSVLKLWRVAAPLQGLAVAVALAVPDTVLRLDDVTIDFALPPRFLVPVAGLMVVTLIGLWWAGLRYRAWRFDLTDDWIYAQWGVVTHRTTTIPRNRVQTVTTNDGPIDRVLGLTSVVIHTAGAWSPDLHIPHLGDDTVEWLRRELVTTDD